MALKKKQNLNEKLSNLSIRIRLFWFLILHRREEPHGFQSSQLHHDTQETVTEVDAIIQGLFISGFYERSFWAK